MTSAERGPGTPEGSEPVRRSLVCRIAATVEELDAHFSIRQESFVQRQGLFAGTDRDEHDSDPRTMHLVAVCVPTGEICGSVRCYVNSEGIWYGGRLVVAPAWRQSKLKIAPALVRAAEEHVRATGSDTFLAYIQCRYVKLFEHVGWVRIGDEVEYAGTPHQLMRPSWSAEPAGVRDRLNHARTGAGSSGTEPPGA